MTSDKIKRVMDACYMAKRVRDMLPALPGGVTSSHIHYLDTIRQLESMKENVKVSDISDMLGLPRPSVTKTIKDMENLGFVKKMSTKEALVDTYVDQYFNGLSKELSDITDEQANIMIEVVEKFYTVMSKRKV